MSALESSHGTEIFFSHFQAGVPDPGGREGSLRGGDSENNLFWFDFCCFDKIP